MSAQSAKTRSRFDTDLKAAWLGTCLTGILLMNSVAGLSLSEQALEIANSRSILGVLVKQKYNL
ncbi:hypothetical protein [Bathymodiolus japonicus methanotrophic gill symbiont]|uniref:hypothetical protein n=1 Tax=Bathymodiolus japonicus methanotrophic gill symbiont TaxID=113269 RepID=UPI001C8E3FE3|nr:hypothetical protein [Bathymodiolus japonicus methanotrophic gill symbiont]